MKKYLLLICFFIFNVMQCYASTQAKFGLVAGGNTSMIVPANRVAYIQYTVTNNTSITRTLTMVPIPTITQVTNDPSQCANPYFVLQPGKSCKLTLFMDGLYLKAHSGGPIICKTKGNSSQPDLFMCSQPEPSMTLSVSPASAVPVPTNFMYVTNWSGNSISLCYIQSTTLTNCLVSGVSGSFINPEALAFNLLGDTLFVANIGGGISSCAVDAVTGELSNCSDAVNDASAPLYGPDGISIQNVGGNETAYISNSGLDPLHQGITVCAVSGAALTGCTFTKGDASFDIPSDLAVTDGYVYVTNLTSNNLQTTYCALAPDSTLCDSPDTGFVSETTGLLDSPEGLFFAVINSQNYAYFTNNGSNNVVFCKVTTGTPPTFSDCSITTEGSFTGFGNLAISPSATAPIAFVPSGLKTIQVCAVDTNNGDLKNCTNATEQNFNNPSGVIIK